MLGLDPFFAIAATTCFLIAVAAAGVVLSLPLLSPGSGSSDGRRHRHDGRICTSEACAQAQREARDAGDLDHVTGTLFLDAAPRVRRTGGPLSQLESQFLEMDAEEASLEQVRGKDK